MNKKDFYPNIKDISIKPNSNYFPTKKFYELFPNDIPLKNFKWRDNLCYCYSILQYIVRIPEINNAVLQNTHITSIIHKDDIIFEITNDNIPELSFPSTINKKQCNQININEFFDILKIHDLFTYINNDKLNNSSPSLYQIETIYLNFFKIKCLIDDVDDPIKSIIIKINNKYLFDQEKNIKEQDTFKIYVSYYLFSLYIIFVYLTEINPFKNDIFKKIYVKYCNLIGFKIDYDIIDFNTKNYIDKDYDNNDEMQNFLHIFIYIIAYHFSKDKLYINSGSIFSLCKSIINMLFNINQPNEEEANRNGNILLYDDQICYILENNAHYINLIKDKGVYNKRFKYTNNTFYYIDSAGYFKEANGITKIDTSLEKNKIINNIKTYQNPLILRKTLLFTNPNNVFGKDDYNIVTGGKNKNINQIYKSYLYKYYNI